MNDIEIIILSVGAFFWTAFIVIVTAAIALQYRKPIHEVVEVKELIRYPSEMLEFKKDFIVDPDLYRSQFYELEEMVGNEIQETIFKLVRDMPREMFEIISWETRTPMRPREIQYSVRLKVMPPKESIRDESKRRAAHTMSLKDVGTKK